MTLSPAVRKLALTVHLTSSVGWVGAVIAYLGLSGMAVASSDTQTIRAAWIAMEVTGWWVIVPLAIAALATGIMMSVGTRWGLFRHYWTLISLALTVVCTVVLLVHMPTVSGIASMARTAPGSDLRGLGGDFTHPGVGLLLLLAITVLNVYKPAGLTPYGWRKQGEEQRGFHTRASAGSAKIARTGPAPVATQAGYFLFHFAEMWFAMLVGMGVFMAVIIASRAVVPASIEAEVGMSICMVAPMAAWMRVRGCTWRECGGMSAAMLLPTLAILMSSALQLQNAQLWLGSNQHLLMLAAMLIYMIYRREHYTSGYSLGRWRSTSRRNERVSA